MLNKTFTIGWLKPLTWPADYTGFDNDAPCKAILTSLDPYPELHVHPNKSDFTSNFSMAVYCRRHNNTDSDYEYCFTLDTEFDFDADIHVNEKIRLVLKISSLSIAVKKILDSKRGFFTTF